jgi:hypothetical protein
MAVPKAVRRVNGLINTWGIFYSTHKHTHTRTLTQNFCSHVGLLVVVLGLLIIVGLSLSYCKSGRPHRRISVPR